MQLGCVGARGRLPALRDRSSTHAPLVKRERGRAAGRDDQQIPSLSRAIRKSQLSQCCVILIPRELPDTRRVLVHLKDPHVCCR